MVTELEAANNLLQHICAKLRAAGYDVQDPIEIPDAVDELIEASKDFGGHDGSGDR